MRTHPVETASGTEADIEVMTLPLLKPDSALADFELLELLDRCTRQARERLVRFGTVWPFGAYVCPAGYVHALESDPANYTLPHYVQYEILHDRLVAMAWDDRLIAYSLAAQINVPPELDAASTQSIRVHFESPGISTYLYTPFLPAPCRSLQPTAADRQRMRFIEPFAAAAHPNVFGAEAPPKAGGDEERPATAGLIPAF